MASYLSLGDSQDTYNNSNGSLLLNEKSQGGFACHAHTYILAYASFSYWSWLSVPSYVPCKYTDTVTNRQQKQYLKHYNFSIFLNVSVRQAFHIPDSGVMDNIIFGTALLNSSRMAERQAMVL